MPTLMTEKQLAYMRAKHNMTLALLIRAGQQTTPEYQAFCDTEGVPIDLGVFDPDWCGAFPLAKAAIALAFGRNDALMECAACGERYPRWRIDHDEDFQKCTLRDGVEGPNEYVRVCPSCGQHDAIFEEVSDYDER